MGQDNEPADGDGPGDPIELDIGGQSVRVTSPNKVYFPKTGATKLDLINYYLAVREAFLGVAQGRPTLMQRYPDGASGKSFFQKRVPKGTPEWVQTTTVATVNGTPSKALVIADMAHAVWAVNLGCLGFHLWPFLAFDPGHSDELRIDLDPMPKVPFSAVAEAAEEVRTLLGELGVESHPKTTASKGIHIFVRLLPRWDAYQVRSGAVAVARELERRRPDLMTAAWWKEERGTRVFVDFNQNAPHKTMFAAWSVRARVGAQVSTPFSWDELDSIKPEELTLETVPERLRTSGDPWMGHHDRPQSLEPVLALHEADMAAGLMDAPWPPQYPKMPNEPPRVQPSRARKPDPVDGEGDEPRNSSD